MENASKALLMAAGVLIGVLIASLASYMFIDFGTTSASIHTQVEEQKLTQFNTQFTSYENKQGLTIYDVATIAGYAKENNKKYEEMDSYENDYKIEVILRSSGVTGSSLSGTTRNLQDFNTNKIVQDEQKNVNGLNEYKCDITEYHSNGRVATIVFTKK